MQKNYDLDVSFHLTKDTIYIVAILCGNQAAAAEGAAADTGFESDVPYTNFSFESEF